MPELLVKKTSRSSKRPAICIIFVIAMLTASCACLSGYVCYLIMFRDTEICSTKDCLKSALKLMSSMDPTIDPCNDFYQFTCGNYWNSVTTEQYIPYQKRNKKIMKLLTEEISGDEWKPFLFQKQYFQACINLTNRDESNKKILYDLLMEIGGWPVIEGTKWKNFEIDEAIVRCRQLGLPADWYFRIYFNELQNKMEITVPNIIADSNDPFNDNIYLELMVEIAVHFGGSRILAMGEMRKVLYFEKQLKKISNTKYYNTNEWAPGELTRSFSYFNFYYVLNSTDSKMPLQRILADVHFLNELNLLLAGTSRRTHANFFIWKIIQYFGIHLPSPIREFFVKFHYIHKPIENLTNTYRDMCLNDAKQRFPYIVELAHLKESTKEAAIEDVKEMLTGIKDTYIERIQNSVWIDRETKYKAKNKVRNIFELIGYRDVDYDNFPRIMKLNFSSTNIIEIIREINIYNYKCYHDFEGITGISKYSKAIMEQTLTENAAYIETMNMIIIGTPILEKRFFSKNKPYYLNYGALGSIVSRQIAHGFYLDALTHDIEFDRTIMQEFFTRPPTITEQFNMNRDFLWNNRTYDDIYARVTCIDDQWNEWNGGMVKNKVFSSNNFADILGTEIAYASYQNWVKQNYKEPQLPGLLYTPNQMFWLELGSQFCNKIEDNLCNALPDIKTSLRYSILKFLKNCPNFAADFKCKEGSEMNPVGKCSIF